MRRLVQVVSTAMIMAGASGIATPALSETGNGLPMTAHEFSFDAIDGGKINLSDFKGKAVLVVNTASRCGFTRQYSGLETIWREYQGKGLVVLGVPSNDFGGQEPGAEDEIKSFCEVNFDISFPMTSKQVVKGKNAHPFYQWVSGKAGIMGKPRWNFHKYLISPDGELDSWYASTTSPDSSKMRQAIESVLPDQS